jgi:pimeloyl-ACP methyl ester carboxylesterase
MSSSVEIPEVPLPIGDYVMVGPLRMYHDSLGAGRPVLLLHGGLTTIDVSFEKLRPFLASYRRTIGIEQQGHGRTLDLDRLMTYEQMVEDTAELLDRIGVSDADIVGWSDGGIVALGLASRRPDLVRRAVVIGAGYLADAETPKAKAMLQGLDPNDPGLVSFRTAYEKVAPRPQDWPELLRKVKGLWAGFAGWDVDSMRGLSAPCLIMLGDRDFIRLEHAVELFRLIPNAQLAVLPATDHGVPLARAEWIAPILMEFFEASFATANPVTE